MVQKLQVLVTILCDWKLAAEATSSLCRNYRCLLRTVKHYQYSCMSAETQIFRWKTSFQENININEDKC